MDLLFGAAGLTLQVIIELVRARLDLGGELGRIVIFLRQFLFGDWRLAVFARNFCADDDLMCAQQCTGHTVQIKQRVFAGAVRGGNGGSTGSGLEHHGGICQRLTVESDDTADASDVRMGRSSATGQASQHRQTMHDARSRLKPLRLTAANEAGCGHRRHFIVGTGCEARCSGLSFNRRERSIADRAPTLGDDHRLPVIPCQQAFISAVHRAGVAGTVSNVIDVLREEMDGTIGKNETGSTTGVQTAEAFG